MVTRWGPVLLVAALVLTGCGGQENDEPATDSASDTNTPSESPTTESSEESSSASSQTPTEQSGPCSYEPDGSDGAEPPSPKPEKKERTATLTTGDGELTVTLDGKGAPCTVNSFASLAEQGFYDGVTCHRLTTQGIYVLQCGDPTGTGSGGPGYSFEDELKTARKQKKIGGGGVIYPAGTLAMANAGPDTNGSQFFLVYQDSPLAPSYTVFGSMDSASTKTVAQIADRGTDSGAPDGAPAEPVTLDSVTLQ